MFLLLLMKVHLLFSFGHATQDQQMSTRSALLKVFYRLTEVKSK